MMKSVRLGRYEIVAEVGKGAMGVVDRAIGVGVAIVVATGIVLL